jgi:hypothetical protein
MSELGATSDPRALIPGAPEAIEENVIAIRGRGQSMIRAGEGLQRIDTGAWGGEAADAFRDKFSYEPPKWLTAGDSLRHRLSRFGGLCGDAALGTTSSHRGNRALGAGRGSNRASTSPTQCCCCAS